MPPIGTIVRHYAFGMCMGAADIVQGVSGGTVALILGIYERLIASLSAIAAVVLRPFRGRQAEDRHRTTVEWSLLFPLGFGIVTAIGVGSLIIPPLLDRYPIEARGLFLGLVAASILIPWLRLRHRGGRALLIAAIACVLAFLLVGLPPREIHSPSTVWIFGSAAVAICAMILPGVSGAFLLGVLGIYHATLTALSTLDVGYVLTFIAGAVVGLGLFVRILHWLLRDHHDTTMAVLVGLMAGALRALWPWQAEDRALLLPGPDEPVIPVVLLAVLGFVLVTAMILWSRRITTPGVSDRPNLRGEHV
jgi:putative membrane protein